jgi:hypothetical protein
MNSQKIAGILGTIVAAAVLVIAFIYGPIGKPPSKAAPKAEPAAQSAAPPPPAARGPVVREVPQ